MSRGAWLGVAALVLLTAGILLRVVGLDLGWFGIDQARDVATALDVAAGLDAPTLGPTMRRVVRLGAGYYYFWAVPYLVSRDPMAGYWFAAGLSIVAMLLVAALARRLWGPRSGLLTLAFAATNPVWVIDGRVAWAPAALPAVGALLLWLLLGPRGGALSAGRVALVGALLGVAVQLHLTMVAWVLAVGLVVLLERPAGRVVLAGIAGGLLTGLPALAALVVGSAHGSGLGAVTGRGATDFVVRMGAVLSLGWRVPTAFSRWPDATVTGPWLVAATAVMAVLVVYGLGRLLRRGTATRSARLVLALTAIGGGLVVALPGEAWWYYLDGLLPVAALAAGAAVAPAAAHSWHRGEGFALVAGVAASAVLAGHLAALLYQVDRHGYLAVEPRLLSLDTNPGEDAAVPGRMLSVRWLRAFAEHVVDSGASLATIWQRLHGPALGDVAGDNGFWLRWALAARAGQPDTNGATGRHLAVWYADAAPELGAARAADDLEITAVGPLRIARYTPAINYASCRGVEGFVQVPIRIVPHPKDYGDGRPARPRNLPARIDCTLRPGTTAVHLVAHLDGPGTVRLRSGGAASSPAGETSLCVNRTPSGGSFTLELRVPPAAAAALDLYDLPRARCSPGTAGAGARFGGRTVRRGDGSRLLAYAMPSSRAEIVARATPML